MCVCVCVCIITLISPFLIPPVFAYKISSMERTQEVSMNAGAEGKAQGINAPLKLCYNLCCSIL